MTPRHLYRRLSHLLVTVTLFLGALAAEVHQENVTVSPNSPNFSVNFGTVAPGDMLKLTITGLPEGLKSASATPSEGPGAWAGGLQDGVECGTAVFVATIPADFSGEHTGNFAGEFCLSGDGDGDEDGSPPTWSGDSVANVKKRWRGPIVGTVAFIADFDPENIDILDLLEAHKAGTGEVLTAGRGTALLVALNELANSANPPPPATFTPATWATFKDSKEYRGFIVIQPEVCCEGGAVADATVVSSEHSFGFTPIRATRDEPAITYEKGEGMATGPTITGVDGTTATFDYGIKFRVGKVGQILSDILTGVAPPFAWTDISYTVDCDGDYEVEYGGSNFPTLWFYKAGGKVAERAQTDLPAFMFAGAGVLAPGGTHHTENGVAQ